MFFADGLEEGDIMAGLITMDDLSNEEIISILDDAERLLPGKRRYVSATFARQNP